MFKLEIQNPKNWHMVQISEIENPEKHLIIADKILKKLKVKYYLGFGTALGFHRDKDFIPNDTDIDINIMDYDKVDETIHEFAKVWDIIRIVRQGGFIQQVAFQDEDGMIIDLSYFIEVDKEYITSHEEGIFVDNVDTIGDCPLMDTKYGKYPFPAKIEEYLEAHYGDWKTPANKKSKTA
jgi:phosphorylcholine metabolism protein LicD